MTRRQPLDHCFRYSGAPGTDPLVHAALIEVLMWRMLHERRQTVPDLDGLGALERWVREQRETLARAANRRTARIACRCWRSPPSGCEAGFTAPVREFP